MCDNKEPSDDNICHKSYRELKISKSQLCIFDMQPFVLQLTSESATVDGAHPTGGLTNTHPMYITHTFSVYYLSYWMIKKRNQ